MIIFSYRHRQEKRADKHPEVPEFSNAITWKYIANIFTAFICG